MCPPDSSNQEEDLDSQQGVIDFSLYLRSKRDVGNEDELPDDGLEESDRRREISTILDQKNYVEELNRHLT